MDDIIINETANPNTIRYRVVLNPVASKAAERDIYTGVAEVKEILALSHVMKRMAERGCAAKKSTIQLVLNDFAEVVSDLVAEGYAVNIPGLVRFSPAIRGTFASEDAPWQATENQVIVNASIGGRMRKVAAKSSVQRIGLITLPTLTKVTDVNSQEVGVITSEGVFYVAGTLLNWDVDAADEGFFLNCGGEETRCTVIEHTAESAMLQTDQIFETADLPLELFFRTRIEGTYHQVKYPDAIVTATAE